MTFKTGQICYTRAGQKCRYLALIDAADEHVVEPALEGDEESEGWWGAPFRTGQLYPDPPTELYDEGIARLRAEIEELVTQAQGERDKARKVLEEAEKVLEAIQ